MDHGVGNFSKVVDGCNSYAVVLNKQLDNYVYATLLMLTRCSVHRFSTCDLKLLAVVSTCQCAT